MSLQRRLSWNTALAGVRADRTQAPAGLLAAKARVDLEIRMTRRPLFKAGQFDRGAIMRAAAAAARVHQDRFGGTWAQAMTNGLTAAWRAAKLARHMAAH